MASKIGGFVQDAEWMLQVDAVLRPVARDGTAIVVLLGRLLSGYADQQIGKQVLVYYEGKLFGSGIIKSRFQCANEDVEQIAYTYDGTNLVGIDANRGVVLKSK